MEEVKRELNAILQSPAFSHASRQAKLLEFLCNKVLLGEADQIKAATIAIEVFGRPWDFDEGKDAIVRVEAHRLRRKLAKYYESEGAKSPLRIVLAPGGYVPEFVHTEESASERETSTSEPLPATDLAQLATPGFPVPDGPQGHQRRLLILGLCGFVLTAIGASVFVARGGNTKGSARKRDNSVSANSAAAMAAAPDIRILAGQTKASYVDRFGRQWDPDHFFTGGVTEPGPKDFYGRPPDAGLFATMRTGDFSYAIPVLPGEYELRLYWAEPIFRLANESNGGGENERRFHVSINGKRVLSAFDVVADSGISPVAIRAFRGIVAGPDGKIHIQFAAAYGTPFVNGLELIRVAPGGSIPIRIRAHELSFTDHEGDVWSPDNYYVGGRLATHKQPVAGTPDPDLYAGERYGNFSYAIPVPDGKYAVTLYFAETWFRPDSNGQDYGGKGDRIFDVYCNGTTLLKDLDVFAKVGPFRALSHTYHGIRPNGQGKILLTFTPIKNYASVKAIEVVGEP